MSEVGKSLLKGAQEALEYLKENKEGARTHEVKVRDEISNAT